ncbi:FAD/NAD(P)-binding domain-containing protein [Xylaria castorea]|nr:FAD/NAD(P)-binding domain-containing protein [Xylaria castorea]
MALNMISIIVYFIAISSIPALYCNALFVSTDRASYDLDDVIERDVVVIGGGSSGTYSSIRLKDYNKTIVVVEKKATLGGHAEAWVEPSTGTPIDIGTIVFAHLDTVTNYFARFNLSLITVESAALGKYVDFSTGEVTNYNPPSQEAFRVALSDYLDQLKKYPALQDGFNMSYPVAPDLLLSFGDFAKKYQLDDLVPQVFLFNQGAVPILDVSMLYTFKYLNSDEVSSLEQGFLTTEHHSTTELYQKAAEYLGSDVLFNSTVIGMDRSCPKEVRVAVQTGSGRKLIIAKSILSTIPPVLENLGGYDLSAEEVSLFGQFFANGYYTGVLNNTGLDEPLIATGPGRRYDLPVLPGIYTATPIVIGEGGMTQIYYGSPTVLPDEQVQADIVATIRRYQDRNGLPVTEPNWLKFSSHSPFNLMVSNDAIADGFYKKLFSLQGQRNTFYNGAAWQTQDSSVIWKFTDDYVIPKILG